MPGLARACLLARGWPYRQKVAKEVGEVVMPGDQVMVANSWLVVCEAMAHIKSYARRYTVCLRHEVNMTTPYFTKEYLARRQDGKGVSILTLLTALTLLAAENKVGWFQPAVI